MCNNIGVKGSGFRATAREQDTNHPTERTTVASQATEPNSWYGKKSREISRRSQNNGEPNGRFSSCEVGGGLHCEGLWLKIALLTAHLLELEP